ncbi:hypothetical protein [Flavobacterium subsaxonicum]|uniref:Uncharacterized protein n=1 Tax=Flavobacterium subsaxonicum WB 4.1-42 = DSM 21790 TaxID=1121898 RepID=A0A0A2MNE4_9FLAO|nr:hypothetical protein [Flavobacterium subsaxonicum]KGO93086.1 hypothetical protein Q766_10775 [Flavobacterium subsaxonicum WB 4.1-42 = DSM 21790]
MGLDISVITDNYDNLLSGEYMDNLKSNHQLHGLSRTFCNFMCRKNVVDHIAELDQIGEITNVDVSVFYDMEAYPDDEGLEFFLETAENEEERGQIVASAEADKQKVSGNIDLILNTVATIINRLTPIDNLPAILLPTEFDSLNNAVYFTDFKKDKVESYTRNNFGQDLRNFKQFLEYAKNTGATTVWFTYN